ncbi:lipoprotein [Spiroplasma turonicum]
MKKLLSIFATTSLLASTGSLVI